MRGARATVEPTENADESTTEEDPVHHPLVLYLARPRDREEADLAHRPRFDRPEPRDRRSGVLARFAAWHRGRETGPAPATPVRIRLAGPGDSTALAQLARLDERRPPVGEVLVAEVDDALVAALPLDDGPAIRHPLRRSADVVELLELRRLQLRAGRRAA